MRIDTVPIRSGQAVAEVAGPARRTQAHDVAMFCEGTEPLPTSPDSRGAHGNASSSDTLVRGAGCPNWARPDLREPRGGNCPRPPDWWTPDHCTIGIAAAVAGGWFDLVATRVVDAVMAFPSLILALIVLSVLGTSIPVLVAVMAVLASTVVFRLRRWRASTAASKPTGSRGPARRLCLARNRRARRSAARRRDYDPAPSIGGAGRPIRRADPSLSSGPSLRGRRI